MREDICSIPIGELFGPKKGCPFCRMDAMLESRLAEYITGAAMMEPDVRIETNRLGFCAHHFDKICEVGNRLSIATSWRSGNCPLKCPGCRGGGAVKRAALPLKPASSAKIWKRTAAI